MTPINKTTAAVMVLYKPDPRLTMNAVQSLRRQTDALWLVDNTPGADDSRLYASMPGVHYVALGNNRGIAAAQNEGIRRALADGYGRILLSDQDSTAPDGTVEAMHRAMDALDRAGVPVAAVGTRPFNRRTGLPYPPKSLELGTPPELKTAHSTGNGGDDAAPKVTECYSVISSMSLITGAALTLNGGMDESLFIDGVDHEWCWRAWHSHGLRTFIAEEARIDHSLGEGDRRLGGRDVAIASAFRTYYQFRNYLWLRRRGYTPRFWKKRHALKYAVKAFYFPLMVAPRLSYLRNITRGVRDGLDRKGAQASFPRF